MTDYPQSDDEFEYDVAISFCQEDESIALELCDLLSDRLSVFVYSKKQEVVAGTDGEETFNRVFSKDARVVVVLYRAKWGTTRWTQIEETAIRNRGFDETYDFALMVPVEKGVSVPRWFPKQRIWIGLEQYGIKSTAAIIELRVQEAGGTVRQMTLADRAAQAQRNAEFEKQRKTWRWDQGVAEAKASVAALSDALETKVSELSSSSPDLGLRFKSNRREIGLIGTGAGALTAWHQQASNTIDDAYLDLAFYDMHPPMWGVTLFERPNRIGGRRLTFDLSRGGVGVWRDPKQKDLDLSAQDLADRILIEFIELIEKRARK